MSMMRIVAAAFAGWLLLTLPATAQAPAHPLAGKIVDTRTGALADLGDPALLPKLFACGAITLLGEVHDNGTHHRMRADLIRSVEANASETCRAAAFVFEHVSADQQAGLDKLEALDSQARRLTTADDLFRLLDWDKSGWPASDLFAPLMQEVLLSRRPILAGNPARDATRKAAKTGTIDLEPEQLRRLGLSGKLPADLDDDLLGELEASHCGLMPKSAFGNMALAQRYRDANIADVALNAATSGNVLIFAGNGHVRTDRGVPYYLKARDPARTVIAVAFIETKDGKTDPAAYGPRDPQGKPVVDYMAFALPSTREDPCEQMRRHMKK